MRVCDKPTNYGDLPAELVVLGIGILAEDELAQASGLECRDGIVVDNCMRTSDPQISAIGDCACHPNPWSGGMTRLESIQNASDQARVAAQCIVGSDVSYKSLPWFWSDQGKYKLQIAGLLRDADIFVMRGDPNSGAFSIFAFEGTVLRAVESVNQSGDHMAARRLLAQGTSITPEQVGDPALDLKALALSRRGGS